MTANAVFPGFIETEAVQLHDPKMLDRIRARTPMKRLGKPEEVSSLVVALAGEDAGFITGTAIPVTGGADLFVF
ncbi:MAG: SDR family oxidoreductase [Pseudomonadota bacterium]